ncbi:MAG: type II secretion system protein GspH [Gammaproteobacteria bacterium]|nr:MAG: type II secretion system protein GspH [Gammaproteobacteria bacterium]
MRGYTLIEILIVLFITSIVTSVALLSLHRNENKQVESLANELTQMLTLAEEQAMLQPSVLGLTIGADRFQFTRLQKDRWVPVEEHAIPEGMQLRLEGEVIISMNGDITPFTLYVGKKGEKPRYAVRGDVDGTITSKALY